MASIYDWSTTAASNSTADSDINWSEGQAPSTVNNSARQVMGRVAELLGDIGGALSAGGTANAITVTANSSFTSYADGLRLSFTAGSDNTGSATLNVNAIGAKAIRKITSSGDADVESGDIQSGCVYEVIYSTGLNSSAGGWQIMQRPEPAARTDYVPTGAILPFAGSTAPTDFLLCYGQAVSRTTYSDLFTAIGTTYGAGDSSTTFNVPDLRGRVVAGQDDMGGTSANRLTNQTGGVNGDTLGATGGSETHTLTDSEMPEHTHAAGTLDTSSTTPSITIPTRQYAGSGSNDANRLSQGSSGASTASLAVSSGSHKHDITGSTASAGSDDAHNNVQPTIVLNYIIRV